MEALFPWVLLLHVLGAVVAFGPTFAFPIIGKMGAAEPMHGNFALRVSKAISSKIVVPLAVFQGVTGLALIGIAQINPFDRLWLLVSIILYAAALAISFGSQTPNLKKMIELTSTPPPPGASGPPPEFLAAAGKVGRNGMILSVLVVLIVFLMVVKPAF